MILVLVFGKVRTAFNFFLVKAYKLGDTEIVVILNSKNSKVESLLYCLRNKVYVAYSKLQCHSCLVGSGISTCFLWACTGSYCTVNSVYDVVVLPAGHMEFAWIFFIYGYCALTNRAS